MATDVQLYTGEPIYTEWQIRELDKPLDKRLESKRRGGGGRMLTYIEGHDAIDQANRIFGYGNWGYEPVSLEQVVLEDPISKEAVGIEYKALVKLTVRGAIAPIVDVGSQPVATWNVEDQIMQRRLKASGSGKVNESPFTLIEKREARAVIVEAHEQAKKGAVTDALKRALRAYGNQFGNGLYGDGHTDLSEPAGQTVVESVHTQEHRSTKAAPRALPPAQSVKPAAQPVRPPVQEEGPVEGKYERSLSKDGKINENQKNTIRYYCEKLGQDVPVNLENMAFDNAAKYLDDLKQAYRKPVQPQQKAS